MLLQGLKPLTAVKGQTHSSFKIEKFNRPQMFILSSGRLGLPYIGIVDLLGASKQAQLPLTAGTAYLAGKLGHLSQLGYRIDIDVEGIEEGAA